MRQHYETTLQMVDRLNMIPRRRKLRFRRGNGKQVANLHGNTLTNYRVGILEPSFSEPPQLRTNADGVLLTAEVRMSVAAFFTTDSGHRSGTGGDGSEIIDGKRADRWMEFPNVNRRYERDEYHRRKRFNNN